MGIDYSRWVPHSFVIKGHASDWSYVYSSTSPVRLFPIILFKADEKRLPRLNPKSFPARPHVEDSASHPDGDRLSNSLCFSSSCTQKSLPRISDNSYTSIYIYFFLILLLKLFPPWLCKLYMPYLTLDVKRQTINQYTIT